MTPTNGELEYRAAREDEKVAFLTAVERSFGHGVSDKSVERFGRILEMDRSYCAFDGDQLVGASSTWSFELTVPGAVVPAAGLTMVGVLPSHTRRGILRTMIRMHFEDVASHGEGISVLYASEGHIYQRFGYGLASLMVMMPGVEARRAVFARELPRTGRIRLLDPKEAPGALGAVYDRVRTDTPGMFVRDENWWNNHTLFEMEEEDPKDTPLQLAIWEDNEGSLRAYCFYKFRAGWDDGTPSGKLDIFEFLADSPQAVREMWTYITGVDLVTQVRSWNFNPNHGLSLMMAEPRRLRTRLSDGLWVRVVDLSVALEGRRYMADGKLTFAVPEDALVPANEGVWTLEVVDGKGAVSKATRSQPELTVGIAELGSVYLGGFSFTDHLLAGRIAEQETGAAVKADAMFRSARRPWSAEIF